MSTPIIDQFSLRSKAYLDARQSVATLADLKAIPESTVPDGFETFCQEDGNRYLFHSANSTSSLTGKWRRSDEHINRRNDCILYPYADRVFRYRFENGRCLLYFTGLNIKTKDTVRERSFESVIADLGQEGEEIAIENKYGLTYDVRNDLFRIVQPNGRSNDDVILLTAGGHDFTYVNPSLSYFVFQDKAVLDKMGLNSVVVKNNEGYLYIAGTKVFISSNGFGIRYNGTVYYVASADTDRSEDYEFDLSSQVSRSTFLVLDTSLLTVPNKRTELADVVSVKSSVGRYDTVIAYSYYGSEPLLSGSFGDVFDTRVQQLSKNVDVVFYPYQDRIFEVIQSAGRIRFTGLNIKTKGNSVSKSFEEVMEEVGQEGEYLALGGINALLYDTKTKRFRVADFTQRKFEEVAVIVKGGQDDITYIHPSLSNFVFLTASKMDTVYNCHSNNYHVTKNNSSYISIDGSRICINHNGFGFRFKGQLYYVAASDTTTTEDYQFELNLKNGTSVFLVLDPTALTIPNKRNELADAMSVKTSLKTTDIVVGYCYAGGVATLVGQFKDVFDSGDTALSSRRINDDILFSPQFYAYKHGRRNNENGIGTGWYNRFSLIHISDTHQCQTQYREALGVANGKVNAVVNTGDDGNGMTTSDGDAVRSQLTGSMNAVRASARTPYLQVPGNHDVPGLTKADYFERVCDTVEAFSPDVHWGDAEHHRTYGYLDFDSDQHEGKFRIIMLDPFDYDDGQFGEVYAFMTAVFSQAQVDWLTHTLTDAAENGYHVITMMHYSFGDNSLPFNSEGEARPDATFYQDAFMIPDIIDAFQHGGVLTQQYPDTKGLNDISVNLNCTALPGLKYVAHLFGHIHSKNHYRCQRHDGKQYDMLMLGEAALATYGNALNKAYRHTGTVNGIAFSALHFDTVEQAVYRVAYGSYLNYDKSNSERTVRIPYRFPD